MKPAAESLSPFFVLPWEKCKIETENTFTRAIICHVWKADTAVSGGKKKRKKERKGARERGIFVAGRMDGKGDKAGLKVGPVTVANERIK